jgi:hypothetical protein
MRESEVFGVKGSSSQRSEASRIPFLLLLCHRRAFFVHHLMKPSRFVAASLVFDSHLFCLECCHRRERRARRQRFFSQRSEAS